MNRNQKIACTLLTTALTSACVTSDESAIKEEITKNLLDPGSAQFREIYFSDDRTLACVIFNAKNSFGGYGQFQSAHLRLVAKSWKIVTLEASAVECDSRVFKMIKAVDLAKSKANSALEQIPGGVSQYCYTELKNLEDSFREIIYYDIKAPTSAHMERARACEENLKIGACGVIDDCRKDLKSTVKLSWIE